MRKVLSLFLLLAACSSPAAELGTSRETFVLATTTSTQDSGLLDALTVEFEKDHPWKVKAIAVGSGEAIDLGRRGDADVLLAHSPEAEEQFMNEGHGLFRKPVMRNDFVVAGPPSDPASIRSTTSAVEAFRRIAARRRKFVSRGDDSGTHVRELETWKSAGIAPGGPWYAESGQGMAETLIVASERGAYVLTDSATFTVMDSKTRLAVFLDSNGRDQLLFNPYSVIPVRRARRAEGAQAFANWITSFPGQKFIGEFGRRQYGRLLFIPTAEK